MIPKSQHPFKRPARLALALAGVLSLSACMTQTGGNVDREGIGFHQARMDEVMAARTWRDCRDEAYVLDRKSRNSGGTARYLASAKLLEKCESELGPNAAKGMIDERLHAYALTVQNNIKGGDLVHARKNLAKLKQAFPGKDLRYPDGASFIATMELLLGIRDREDVSEFAVVNASGTVKAELRRVRYWQQN
jgi:hypothetical protein